MKQNKVLIKNFSDTITQYEKHNLAELLLTHNISPSQFKNIVINEVKKSQQMQEAFMHNPASLFASILLCAELGLNPSNDIGEFYFIPFGKKITPILGYKGLISLLLRSGEIAKLWTEIVYEEDDFEFELGLEPKLSHLPNLERNNNNIKYVYAVAKLTNGETMFKVMSKKEIMDVVNMSKASNPLYKNASKDPQGWMFRKTVIKQLSKMLPKDYYGKRGISVDDKVEGGGYLKLDEDNNVMFVDGKRIAPKRNKSIYSNLDIEVEPIESENNISENKKNSLTLDFES